MSGKATYFKINLCEKNKNKTPKNMPANVLQAGATDNKNSNFK